jgi:UDP-3-O-[3-hydroxymyristoyl] glucosamine N-acyltransferase
LLGKTCKNKRLLRCNTLRIKFEQSQQNDSIFFIKTEIKEKVIKKTVHVVKTVKSEENVQFGNDVQFEENEQVIPHVQVEEDVQFEADVLFEDYVQFEEVMQFEEYVETIKGEEPESTQGEKEKEVKKLETMMRQNKVKIFLFDNQLRLGTMQKA